MRDMVTGWKEEKAAPKRYILFPLHLKVRCGSSAFWHHATVLPFTRGELHFWHLSYLRGYIRIQEQIRLNPFGRLKT